ncbi:MAG: hypothetical protein AAGI53_03470 [Planctomycetota bacterium]
MTRARERRDARRQRRHDSGSSTLWVAFAAATEAVLFTAEMIFVVLTSVFAPVALGGAAILAFFEGCGGCLS